MIDYTAVSREIRSLVSRRRELLTFLGSVFAALGLLLRNVLQGELPASLNDLQTHPFATYAVLLLVPTLIIALRLARLNAGMTLNGVLYARLMQDQAFTRVSPLAVEKAARVNVFGVSFLMFLLADLIAGFAAALLALALARGPWAPLAAGVGVVVVWLLLYLHYHRRAARFARQKAATDTCAPFDREQWESHTAESLRDGNHDMLTVIALVGLMVFSCLEGLSAMGRVQADTSADSITTQEVETYGPLVYSLLMAVTCFFGMVTYIRLRVAIGNRSLEIDPTDRPFRPLRLTDSLLGYMLLAFLFALSLHMLLLPRLGQPLIWAADGAAFAAAILLEQVTLVIAGRGKAPKEVTAARPTG